MNSKIRALSCILVGLCTAHAEPRIDRNVVYGMYSGLALLMDVYYPQKPNGYAIVHTTGTGWHDQLGYDASPPKASDQVIDHRQAAGRRRIHAIRVEPSGGSPLPSSGRARGRTTRDPFHPLSRP